MNYRIQPSQETFLTFASRVTRHLVLCSRMLGQEQRQAFVEKNRRLIFKQNLPQSLLTRLEAKEKIYSHFSSSEILEIVVSTQEEGNFNLKNNDSQFERYRVFSVKNTAGTLRPTVKGERREQKEGFFKQEKRIESSGYPRDENHKQGSYQSSGKQRKIWEIKSDKKKFSEETKKKLTIMSKFGFIKEEGKIACFFCLGPHISLKCNIYTEYEPNNQLCLETVNGIQMAYGFHNKKNCQHRLHKQYAFKVNSYQVNRQARVQSDNRQYSDNNSSWRILKRN